MCIRDRKIYRTDHLHTHKAEADYFRIRGINMQQSVTEEIGHIPHNQPYEKDKYFTGDQYLIDPFLFIGAQILAGKAQTGLIKGIHGGINLSLIHI